MKIVKPKLTSVLFADRFEQKTLANGAYEIALIGPTQFFRLPLLPSAFSFVISVGIQGFARNAPHTLRTIFRRPSGSILSESELFSIPEHITKENERIPEEYIGFISYSDIRNLIFDECGVYEVSVEFDGEVIGNVAVYVDAISEGMKK